MSNASGRTGHLYHEPGSATGHLGNVDEERSWMKVTVWCVVCRRRAPTGCILAAKR